MPSTDCMTECHGLHQRVVPGICGCDVLCWYVSRVDEWIHVRINFFSVQAWTLPTAPNQVIIRNLKLSRRKLQNRIDGLIDVHSLTEYVTLFPRWMSDRNSRSMELAAAVRIQGAPLLTVALEGPEFPPAATTRIPLSVA